MDPSKIIIFDRYWTIQDVQEHPTWLFLFGDNYLQKGKKGQAIIRDEPNTFGIPTKHKPTFESDAFFNDDEIEETIKNLRKIFSKLKKVSINYEKIVLPKDGFGTGLAKLPQKAPTTYQYLVYQIEKLKKIL